VPKGVTLLKFEGVYQKEEQPEESKVLADEGVPKKSCLSVLIIVLFFSERQAPVHVNPVYL
jgi:hypothetical protein